MNRLLFSVIIIFLNFFSEFSFFPEELKRYLTYCLTLVFFVINFSCVKYLFCKQYRWVNIMLFGFCLVSLYSSFVNYEEMASFPTLSTEISVRSKFGTVMLILDFLLVICYIESIKNHSEIRKFAHYFFVLLAIYAVVASIDAVLNPVDDEESGLGGVYLLGNKFSIVYTNFYIIVLYVFFNSSLNRRHWLTLFILYFYNFFISYMVYCSTMIVGLLASVIVLYLYKKKIGALLLNPFFAFVTVIVIDLGIVIFYNIVLDIPFVQYIIEDVLHEDLTLTSRIFIYQKVSETINEAPWFGHGLGTVGVYVNSMIDCSNAQNGLLNLFLETGVIGSVLYLLVIAFMCKSVEKDNGKAYILFLYTMFAISAIEVPFNLKFLIFAMIVRLYPWYTKSTTLA